MLPALVDGDRIQEIALWLRLDFSGSAMIVIGRGEGAVLFLGMEQMTVLKTLHTWQRVRTCRVVRRVMRRGDLGKLVEEILWPTVIVSV